MLRPPGEGEPSLFRLRGYIDGCEAQKLVSAVPVQLLGGGVGMMGGMDSRYPINSNAARGGLSCALADESIAF